MNNHLEIDHNEHFPTLVNAPIVEAILNWQAAATTSFFDGEYIAALTAEFPQYEIHPQHNLTTGVQGSDKGITINHSNVVQGARILKKNESGAVEFACQFLRNGIIFSKLAPYYDWNSFLTQAKEMWKHFESVAKPSEISQLATRYISQIPIDSAQDSDKYTGTNCAPLSTLGLSASNFYHQDTFMLGNYPYGINVVRAAQTSADGKNSLIVDISAYTTTKLTDIENTDTVISDLRYIKNKVFFSLMTDAEQNFGGSS